MRESKSVICIRNTWHPYNYSFPTKKINPDYALIIPNCTCFDNFQYNESLNWIGAYKKSDGTFETKPTHFSYYHQKATIGTEVCVELQTDDSPEFIIGSRHTLKTKEAVYASIFEKADSTTTALLHQEMYFGEDNNELLYCYYNRDINLTEEDSLPRSIVWRGDLNEDGIEDFIIKYGEKMAKLVLVLSDNSGTDVEFVKVAEYYFGYCC